MTTFENFGTPWSNIRAAGQEFRLNHLHPFQLQVSLLDGSNTATVKVAFGFHVFTDEKEVGPVFR